MIPPPADGPFALVPRKRFKKGIDRPMRRSRPFARLKLQHALLDRQIPVPRNDIHVICLHRQVVRNLAHRKRRGARQNLCQRAFMLRIEMLHQHEPHTRVERQMLEQLRVRLQPTGGSSDAHNHDAITALLRRALYVGLNRRRGSMDGGGRYVSLRAKWGWWTGRWHGHDVRQD